MLDWIKLFVAIPGCVVACVKLRRLLLRRQPSQSFSWMDLVLSMSMIGTLIFAGIGWYSTRQLENQLRDTHFNLIMCRSKLTIRGVGIDKEKKSAFAEVDTEPLAHYKEHYKAMLIFRVEDNSVNYKTDRRIVKSFPLDIPSHQKVEVKLPHDFLVRSDVSH